MSRVAINNSLFFMKKNYKKKLGALGEKIASLYYQKLGWQIIQKNYLTRYGEIDLVCQKEQEIMLVEVKTRSSLQYGWAEETISNKKINNICNTYHLLRQKEKLPETFQLEICVIYLKNKIAKIKTIQL